VGRCGLLSDIGETNEMYGLPDMPVSLRGISIVSDASFSRALYRREFFTATLMRSLICPARRAAFESLNFGLSSLSFMCVCVCMHVVLEYECRDISSRIFSL